MNELRVIVEQTPGKIGWNFEELKKQLTVEMDKYTSIVYTDDNIKDAKSDVAQLRKLQKEVNERRIMIKKECLEPYEAFEKQAKELTDIIEKPVSMIDEKVKDYEVRRKENVLAYIREYFKGSSESLPESVREKAFQRIYQDKWLNATTAVKTWKSEIDSGIENIVRDYETLKTMQSDFVDEGVEKYQENLMLNEAIQYMNSLQRQKQIAEEKLAKEKEEKERKAEQERIAAEQATIPAPTPREAPQGSFSQESPVCKERNATGKRKRCHRRK